MNLFMQRCEYTGNTKNWPVVPFSLLRNENSKGLFETNYHLGFEQWQIIGFGLSISDELIKSGIKRPTLIWARESNEDGTSWNALPIESKSYYQHVSLYCHKFRENVANFMNACTYRDKQIAESIFNFLDENYSVQNDVWTLKIEKFPLSEDDIKEECIDIYINRDRKERLYFKYQCPCMKFTEMVYPIICEDVVIALVMVGQLVEEKNIIDIAKAYDTNKRLCDLKCSEQCEPLKVDEIEINDIEKIVAVVSNEIVGIENAYIEQIKAERRRIMNITLNDLVKIQREFSLYKLPTVSTSSSQISLWDISTILEPARRFFRDSLDLIEETFGMEQVRLYIDNNLDFECSLDSKFYKKWVKKSLDDKEKEYLKIEGEDGLDDLFKGYDKEPPKPWLTKEDIIPRDPDWSVYIYVNADITDDAGKKQESWPLVIGIKYKGGLKGKQNYLRANYESDSLWHQYVLPKFIIFARNVMLSVYLHKSKDSLLESRLTSEHETGQVSYGLEGISEVFQNRRKIIELYMEKIDSEAKQKFNDFLRYSELYEGDVNGLFLRVKLTSRIYGNNPTPKPREGDIYKDFLMKWKFAFFSNCRESNTDFYLEYYEIKERKMKWMNTDFDFLEHILYNIVGNGIKHAVKYSKISLKIDMIDGYHIFKIINYGDYLNPGEFDIFKRGIQNLHSFNAPHLKGKKPNPKKYKGMGMGLYISKKLADALGGTIEYSCVMKSNYNIPLMDYYFDEISLNKRLDLIEYNIPYFQRMKDEYEKLKTDTDLAEILARNVGGATMKSKRMIDLEKAPLAILFEEMQEPTYEVIFTIKIPSIYKGV